ncbi:hypothetical protein [Phytoactinopolyspora halotolerans]|uniref:Uncharacterized protein n=1 Tax=Phytoactinopolyspora halotolerans TaxID=1981512 RepID=A0A6L9S3Q2_9ACTN|nr:hypothetical protein [Phytoactinopolyspora halotolerans]NED98599.1 hypothetical protein [Phytoactinopolyspora halotolerans]
MTEQPQEEPKYNRFVSDEAAKPVMGTPRWPEQPENRSTDSLPVNPWLTAMSIVGIGAFIIGLVLWIQGSESDSFLDGSASDLQMMIWGQALVWLGVGLLVATMASAAICWQIRQRNS